MKNDMEFEASMKSGITADVEFIKKNDELIEKYIKTTKNSPAVFLTAFLAAIAFYFINKIVMIVCGLIGAAALFIFIRTKKEIHEIKSRDYMVKAYEEGLLVPGMIIRTEPLIILVIAELTALEGCESRYGCYALEVKNLPGAKRELYGKIPCSSLFRYEGGNYHSAFQPRPLYWGTPNLDEIRAALWQLDKEQEENSENEWEILKKIGAAYPDLKPDHILILDEFYQPLGIKHYLDSEFVPVITEKILDQYPKTTPEVPHISDEIPAASVYNKMIDLALKYQVYEYISTHCKGQEYAQLSNPGYFTYIGDPMTFLEAMKENNIAMTEGEYPLIAGSMVLTTKGCWKKKNFTPWEEIQLEAVISSFGEIDTMVNGKNFAAFKVNTQYYQNSASFTKKELSIIRQIETDRLNQFLQELKDQFTAPEASLH